MRSRNVLIAAIAIIGVVSFVVFENDILRALSTAISSIALIYNICAHIFRNDEKFNSVIEKLRGKSWLLKIILKETKRKEILRNIEFYHTKKEILKSNEKLIEKLDGEIFTSHLLSKVDMIIESKEILSQNHENNRTNWRDTSQKQFTIITGKSGCGKSFELRERYKFYHRALQKRVNNGQFDVISNGIVENENKIPIYIELKSLKQKLSREWIKREIISSVGRINGKVLDNKHIDLIIDNYEVVYFFDALDEVNSSYREQSLAEIISLSTETTVFFTCRTKIYEELKYKRNSYTGNKEDELVPPYLEPLEIKLLPLSDEYIQLMIEEHAFTEIQNKYKDDKAFEAAIVDIKREVSKYIKRSTPKFKEQITTPIFFNLFISVFPNLKQDELDKLISGNEDDNMDLLWSQYENIEDNIDGGNDATTASRDAKTLKIYTIWIAKIVGEASFSAESIQPTWLHKIQDDGRTTVESKWQQKGYFLITRIIAAVIIGIGLGLIISTPFTLLSNSILGGVIIACVAGLYDSMRRRLPRRVNTVFSFFLFLLLIVGCGVFQGLSVPRSDEEMTYSFFSLAESWSGVLLGVALGSIFSYRIIIEKKKDQYILPVDRFHFNWLRAIKYGVTVGAISGILVGLIGVSVNKGQTDSIFFNSWLIPHIKDISKPFLSGQLSKREMDVAIFAYGFVVMFIVASSIVTALVGPYNENDFQHEGDKQKLNFNIRKSTKKALLNAIQVAFFALFVYLIFIFKRDIDSLYHGIKMSLGVFLLGFFWFGGMEVVNFIILRRKLNMLGIIPLSYKDWANKYYKLGLITTSGKEMRFYHDSLARYYSDYKSNQFLSLKDTYKTARANQMTLVFLLAFLLLITLPFGFPYYSNMYWEESNTISVVSDDVVREEMNNLFVCQKSGNMHIEVAGSIHVGTFVGRVFPHGTKYGFLGIELDSAYNLKGLGSFRHAALLVRKRSVNDNSWTEYEYVSSGFMNNEKTFIVNKGDMLEFVVNDKEWQNNTSKYRITASIN